MTAGLSNPIFQDAEKAREWLEAQLWPNGRPCPHCGTVDDSTKIEGTKKSHRPGLYMCNACRKQFTVTVGTIFERSHVPLDKWLAATFWLCTSKKGVSSHQLHRMLDVTYKTAWFMSMRIREAMREGTFPGPLGGEGKIVEQDEAYIGGKEANKHRRKRAHKGTGCVTKEAVVSLVERGAGVRSFHVGEVNAKTLRPILKEQLARGTSFMTDNALATNYAVKGIAKHQTVNHSIGEYVRGDVHTNTIEGYFSILKRGITGVYHHVSPQHLKRYLAEFDFRYNERMSLGVDDAMRTEKAIKGIVGKRLTYRRTGDGSKAAPSISQAV